MYSMLFVRCLRKIPPMSKSNSSNQNQKFQTGKNHRHSYLKPSGGRTNLMRGPVYDSIFLRDSCTCELCVDPSTKQKTFQTSDIPADILAVKELGPSKTSVTLKWQNDLPGYPESHRTRFPADTVNRSYADWQSFQRVKQDERVRWDQEKMLEDVKYIEFDDWMHDDHGLFAGLQMLDTHGLLFLKNVPPSEQSVEVIISRIGSLRDTFYGRTWDVKSKVDAKNVAYTHQFLGLHMDLLYMANPPYLQLLHSLHAKAPGGESIFSDSLLAADTIRNTDYASFRVLKNLPVLHHYKNDNQHYRFERPTFEMRSLQGLGNVRGASGKYARNMMDYVNWSPPFQGPFIFPNGDKKFREYHKAACMFSDLVNSESAIFEKRLEEGECVIFNNRRVLHARRAFDPSKGSRWLKGAYVDEDVFRSRLRVLTEKYDPHGALQNSFFLR
ncbi:Clavaminate synthase-like protein [Patellaria atrata CBS 101060]|uniref:Clavaminate synthase-like protein n=1 Tax=Patellaria atrata CBS 101060 TaxID=1346257 RepID=A0A9P4VNG5_9PEZI|nr:Clavaminate synthase-like protein [Patellaria atrata CBS 101060]